MRLRVAVVGAAAVAATVLAPQLASASGTAWVIQSSRTPSMTGGGAFTAISCSSSTKCMGVGTGAGSVGTGFADKWNGTRWRPLSVSAPVGAATSGLQGVSCTSPTACTAVGYYFDGSGSEFTLAERWNGTAWSIESSPSPGSYGPTLLGVSCPSASDCTAVGTYQAVTGGPNVTLAEQWNGVQWTVQSTPSPAGALQTSLSGVSCQSAAACTAVGKQESSTQTLTL